MKFLFAAIIALACTFSAKAVCPGDLNGDLRVGVEDLLIVIDHWGEGTPDGDPMPWDLTGDGRVNVSDILFLVDVWGLGDATNPWSCYPQNAPYDAPPECITSVFEEIPSCEYYWTENCNWLMCQQKECDGYWCP